MWSQFKRQGWRRFLDFIDQLSVQSGLFLMNSLYGKKSVDDEDIFSIWKSNEGLK